MRIAITGHTSGLGKALLALSRIRGHEVIGFSRSNGYDIADDGTQTRIVLEASGADIFINNAHHGFSQCDLFTRLYREWRDSPKLIINIGSIITSERSWPSGPQHGELGSRHYAAEKAGLDTLTHWAWNDTSAKCEVVLVRPGSIQTGRMHKVPDFKTLTAQEVAEYILESVLDHDFIVRDMMIDSDRKPR